MYALLVREAQVPAQMWQSVSEGRSLNVDATEKMRQVMELAAAAAPFPFDV